MADEINQSREVETTDATVGDTNIERQVVRQKTSLPKSIIAKRIVWYIFGLIITLIALRTVLLLLGANQGNAFVDTIYGIAGVFVAPFEGIFGVASYGNSMVDFSGLVAIVVYGLIAQGISMLFTLGSSRTDA